MSGRSTGSFQAATSTHRRPLSLPPPLPPPSAPRKKRKEPALSILQQRQRPRTATHDAMSAPGQITSKLSRSSQEQGAVLPEETLRALRHTRSLFLCGRNIFSFAQIRHLEHMTQLSSINVHMNAISKIEFLGHLKHLTELDISANELRVVDDDALRGLGQLKRLNLSSNFLTEVGGLQHLPALEWLSLSFNELEDVRGIRELPFPENLLHFDICGNKIATLVDLESALENCRNLQELCVQTPRTALVLSTAFPQVSLRENPFCAAEPNYAERLFQRFKRLTALNGEPCSIDPIATDTLRASPVVTPGSCDNTAKRHLPDMSAAPTVSTHTTLPPPLPPPLHHRHQPQSYAIFSEADLTEPASAAHVVNTSSVSETPKHSLASTTGASSSSSNGSENKSKKSNAGYSSSSPKWRTKKVSRGVLTMVSIPLHKELHVSSVGDKIFQEEIHNRDGTIEHLELRHKRLQEQLLLRVALEQDLRRNLKVVRHAYVEFVESAESEKKLLCRQVKALKDELSRRSEEAKIIQRKNRAELEEQTTALRADLQRQKGESSVLLKELKEELSRVCNEASREVRELKVSLSDAVRQNNMLEQQKEKTQACLEEWRSESQRSKQTLLECEGRLKMLDKLLHLELEELLTRRQLEFAAWDAVVGASAAQLFGLQRENASLVASRHNYQRAWEEYTISLQRHYQEALLKSHAARAVQVARVDVGCDPIGALDLGWVLKKEETEAELLRLQTALTLAHQTEHLLSGENERLLRCVAEKEGELKELTQRLNLLETTAQEARNDMERERENFLRTIHNLRETIKKKDEALDELEAEAKTKINEKRAAIAKLEARLQEAEEESVGHRSEAARLRGALEELQCVRAATAPRPELTEALEDAKRKLASSLARENQQALKLTRAAEALSLVREELARVAETNRRLTGELESRTAQLRAVEAERDRLQTQWRESQQAARARQRAAMQALSQIMAVSNEDEL